jgi:hypothetical protein
MAKMGKPMLPLTGAVIANIDSDDEDVGLFISTRFKGRKCSNLMFTGFPGLLSPTSTAAQTKKIPTAHADVIQLGQTCEFKSTTVCIKPIVKFTNARIKPPSSQPKHVISRPKHGVSATTANAAITTAATTATTANI